MVVVSGSHPGMAIASRSPCKGGMFHSDKGSQYCLHDYQNILRQHGFKVSMNAKSHANLREDIANTLKMAPRDESACRVLDALNTFEASDERLQGLERTSLLEWEKRPHNK
jgi:transposase InsO family protein